MAFWRRSCYNTTMPAAQPPILSTPDRIRLSRGDLVVLLHNNRPDHDYVFGVMETPTVVYLLIPPVKVRSRRYGVVTRTPARSVYVKDYRVLAVDRDGVRIAKVLEPKFNPRGVWNRRIPPHPGIEALEVPLPFRPPWVEVSPFYARMYDEGWRKHPHEGLPLFYQCPGTWSLRRTSSSVDVTGKAWYTGPGAWSYCVSSLPTNADVYDVKLGSAKTEEKALTTAHTHMLTVLR